MKIFVTALLLAAASAPAMADEMMLVQSAKPTPMRSYPSRSIDILGIILGMTQEEVTAILRREYGGEPEVSMPVIGISYNGIKIQSQPFVSAITIAKANGDDRINVAFSFPTTGSRVVGVSRTLAFRDSLTAPRVADMFDQLHAKYGPGSLLRPKSYVQTLTFESWGLGAAGPVKCPNDNCPTPYARMDSNTILQQNAVKADLLVVIQANVHNGGPDPSRVQQLEVTMEDNENELLSANQLAAQMKAAAEAAYAKKAVPAAAPRL